MRNFTYISYKNENKQGYSLIELLFNLVLNSKKYRKSEREIKSLSVLWKEIKCYL